eukprot:COSAG01_NODE_6362_length_3712_cov_9.819541_4_plen_322_part_00
MLHANDEVVGHPRKWPGLPSLRVRIGIALGPVVVGFFGLQQPFLYNCWGWTVDEASRLEAAAESDGILLDASAHAHVGGGYKFSPQPAHAARRSGRQQEGGGSSTGHWDFKLESGTASPGKAVRQRPRYTVREPPTAAEKVATTQEVVEAVERAADSDMAAAAGPVVARRFSARSGLSLRPGLRTKPVNRSVVPLAEQLKAGRGGPKLTEARQQVRRRRRRRRRGQQPQCRHHGDTINGDDRRSQSLRSESSVEWSKVKGEGRGGNTSVADEVTTAVSRRTASRPTGIRRPKHAHSSMRRMLEDTVDAACSLALPTVHTRR